ncbi:DUF3772 domain-containing protein [Arhodomonas sp. AD133]|uniref:DUF3772 domain-containing protein n=1 Tax=Arhodomonas sp. AD133 TaxID=3415009 RepID=UPI003EB7FB94
MHRQLFRRHWIVACVVIAVLLPALLLAQGRSPTFEERAGQWKNTAEVATRALENEFLNAPIAEIKQDLRTTIDEATEARRTAQVRLDSARQMLASLGEPPPDEAAPEAPRLADLREEMRNRVADNEAHVARANLAISRANELLQSIADWEQAEFRAAVLRRRPSPVRPAVWREAMTDALSLGEAVFAAPRDWWSGLPEDGKARVLWIYFLAMPLVGVIAGWPVRVWLMRHFGRSAEEPDPSYTRRIVAAMADGAANAVIPAAIIAFSVGTLAIEGVLSGLFAHMVYSSGAAIAAFLVVFGLSRAAVSPQLVAWRIAPVNPAHAPGLLRVLWAIAASLAVTATLLSTAEQTGMLSPQLESVALSLQALFTAPLIVLAAAPRFWESSIAASQDAGSVEEAQADDDGDDTATEPHHKRARSRRWWPVLRGALRIAVGLTPLLALAGYARLAFFVQSRLVGFAVAFGFALLLRLAVREVLAGVLKRPSRSGPARPAVLYWVGLALDIAVALPMVYGLLLLLGVPATTVSLWVHHVLSGIEVGGFTLSVGGLLTAILVLGVGLGITNVVRRWLTHRVLPHTRLAPGARNSIAAGSSYLGVAIAIVLAITSLGLDLSNLALVAGALSVGIGFGLQNVVQNFAAGLLLLIERPIEVGDWVVVNGVEGTVKRISVRSTEIETFDRASVIVPNSNFIASPVTNWTHKNRIARVIVRVGVAYGSDTDTVKETLLSCARAHARVLRYPSPGVFFLGFGDSALNFELRCFVDDADVYLHTLSDLHFAVDAAFREEAITIPFPQRDLHLRSGAEALGEPGMPFAAQQAQAFGPRADGSR